MSNIKQNIELLTEQDSLFRKEIIKLRKLLEIPQNGFKTKKEFETWLEKNNNERYFNVTINCLINEYKLNEKYIEFIAHFLGFNYIILPSWKGNCTIHILQDGQNKLYIEVFGDTTKKDIDRAWNLIERKNLRSKLSQYIKKFKPISTLSLQRRIYTMKKLGKKGRDFLPSLPDGYYHGDVDKLIKRYKSSIETDI
ncbi:MAG: hypothetical protein M1324_01195 [Patescibacteria group bacterium]|nr:hypothetical protein [Patescibacteria group bacterium]